MKAKTLTLEDITWNLIAKQDDIPVKGNCSAIDPETDEKAEQWINDQLEAGNVWAWASVEVRGSYKGLTASDYLVGCSYRSEDDFKQPGGYYDDMRAAVLEQLQSMVDDIRS